MHEYIPESFMAQYMADIYRGDSFPAPWIVRAIVETIDTHPECSHVNTFVLLGQAVKQWRESQTIIKERENEIKNQS